MIIEVADIPAEKSGKTGRRMQGVQGLSKNSIFRQQTNMGTWVAQSKFLRIGSSNTRNPVILFRYRRERRMLQNV